MACSVHCIQQLLVKPKFHYADFATKFVTKSAKKTAMTSADFHGLCLWLSLKLPHRTLSPTFHVRCHRRNSIWTNKCVCCELVMNFVATISTNWATSGSRWHPIIWFWRLAPCLYFLGYWRLCDYKSAIFHHRFCCHEFWNVWQPRPFDLYIKQPISL